MNNASFRLEITLDIIIVFQAMIQIGVFGNVEMGAGELKSQMEMTAIETTGDTPNQNREFVNPDLFAFYLNYTTEFPFEHGLLVHQSAVSRDIDPWDLAAVLISEKSGPEYDFSIEARWKKRRRSLRWDNSVVGREGEIGYFQIKERWARLAGYRGDDLYDPEINIDVAGFVVQKNRESHERCRSRSGSRANYHGWIAHYKCGREDRDKFDGFCRFKQNQYYRIRESLGRISSPNFQEINRRLSDEISREQRRVRRNMEESGIL